MSSASKNLELIALKSQLSFYEQAVINHKVPKPRLDPFFRSLWVALSKCLTDWKSLLVVVKPETVIGWHRGCFKFFWKLKSRRRGRPCISPGTIALIKRIHKENPLLSPEKIHELLINLSVKDAPSPNTIAKYLPAIRKPPSQKQSHSWKAFLKNHNVWSMDFFVVPTINFKILYVFIIVSHARRRIEYFNVTDSPSSIWVVQQIREATPFGHQPKYLLHDNDPVFTSRCFQQFLSNANIQSVRTAFHSPWQNGICERANGILRQNLLNHMIPFSKNHLYHLLYEYITKYYNPHRTHQGIGGETPDVSIHPTETIIANTNLVSEEILGGLYHSYQKAHK